MSLHSVNINDILPYVALTTIFDKLTVKDHMAIMTTCKYWYEILNEGRFLRQRRFKLYMKTLCDGGGDGGVGLWNVEQMQRYRAFLISDTYPTSILGYVPTEQKPEFFKALRAFLSREEVMANVEDLFFRMDQYSLCDVFDNTKSWHFPRLRRIIYHASLWFNSNDNIKIKAPNLRQLEIVDPKMTLTPLVRIYSRQIRELDMKFQDQEILFKAIDNDTLINLHSLTLNTATGNHLPKVFQTYDFSANQKTIFARLKYLKICDDDSLFFAIYEDIFHYVLNLETLIIIGKDMSAGSFNAISNITKLKKLCLMVNILGYYDVNKLYLPKLERLTTYIGSFAPLGSVPMLRWLCIKSHCWIRPKIMPVKGDALQTSLHLISQQLEVLRLSRVDVDPTLLDLIRGLTNLRALEMRFVKVHDSDVMEILHKLPALQVFSMSWCNLVKYPEHQYDWHWKQTMYLEDEEKRDFFETLKLDLPDVSIKEIETNWNCTG
ncbi:uncharacterized protein LOC129773001 [Toxorhynchites rutilus septentrionalis]|uniref:uncharacterized protein LOC129773001 n=1 Tax=Toxorhynchites rutilus septentrionalis TaxID=329112 RepID=UPI00247B1AF3|nr:uncharacterized protein LOC129773001 [Toxorhynchites rutilus septentrionalis]